MRSAFGRPVLPGHPFDVVIYVAKLHEADLGEGSGDFQVERERPLVVVSGWAAEWQRDKNR